jgi:Tetracyclin repressor-like, C-terminal domain
VQRRHRASLAAGQIVGLGFIRHVRQLGPVTSASPADLAAAIGPTIRRHLTGDLASG